MMAANPILDQIVAEVEKMNPQQQEQLLRMARGMQQSPIPVGTPGEVMLADLEQYEFAPGALDEMLSIIEEGTKQIDWDGWK
jgi:hypothetical protein